MSAANLLLCAALALGACTVHRVPAAAPGPESYGERTPWAGDLTCVGSSELVIRDAIIDVAGDGPTAIGSCRILVINSEIYAGDDALVVRGSGEIVVRDSLVAGRATAINVFGSGDVFIDGSEVRGSRRVFGSGRIHEL